MTFIFFVFMLLFANMYSHSKNIDFADADYCIDWKSPKTELYRGQLSSKDVRLVFVKKNNDLKKIQDTIKCFYSYSNMSVFHSNYVSASFYFIDESDREIFYFEMPIRGGSGIWMGIDGPCMTRANCSESEYYELHKWTPPKIQIQFPPEATYLKTTLEKFSKDNLLQFKNKIIDAQIKQKVTCKPDFDTTYIIDFRARITGECGGNLTEDKKDTQKNKK